MYTAKLPALKLAGTAQSLGSAALIATYIAEDKVIVKRISFLLSVATVSTAPIVLQFVHQPIIGSSVGQIVIGTITIPSGVAAGQVYYNSFSGASAVLQPGETIAVSVTTPSAGGGAAGAGYVLLQEVEESPENAINYTNAVAVSS